MILKMGGMILFLDFFYVGVIVWFLEFIEFKLGSWFNIVLKVVGYLI